MIRTLVSSSLALALLGTFQSQATATALPSCLAEETLVIKLTSSFSDYSISGWEQIIETKNYKKLLLVLNSNGGQLMSLPGWMDKLSLQYLLESIRSLRSRGIKTSAVLLNDAVCRSACTGILPYVDEVIASSTAVIGFHSGWRIGEVFDSPFAAPRAAAIPDANLTQWYLNKLEEGGVSPEWIRDQKNRGVFSRLDYTDFKPSDLLGTGFVFQVRASLERSLCDPLKAL